MIRCWSPFGPSQRTLASIVIFAGFNELLLSTRPRGRFGSVALLNSAAVSPPWIPGSPNVIRPLHAPSFPFPGLIGGNQTSDRLPEPPIPDRAIGKHLY